MLDLTLKTSEGHPLEKFVKRAEESDRHVALWAVWIFSWLQQRDYCCFPPFVRNLLFVNAVIEHVQEPKPCGWSEAFDHFMMDVIHARGFVVFGERYGISKVLDGERCQDGFMYAFHLRPRGSNGTVAVRLIVVLWPVRSMHRAAVLVLLTGETSLSGSP